MIADIIVILIVAMFVYFGYRRGLVRSLVGFLSLGISIVSAIVFYPSMAKWLTSTALYEKLHGMVNENYISGQLDSLLESTGVLSGYIKTGIETAAGNITDAVTALLVNIAAFLLVLVISKIALCLLEKVLGVITKLPIIKQFNRLGGAALGGILGVLVLYIAFAAMAFFAPVSGNAKITSEIENSQFAKKLYTDNFILNLVDKGDL